MASASLTNGSAFQGALMYAPMSGFIIATIRSPTSVSCDAPSALRVLSLLPKMFITSGIFEIVPSASIGFSNKTAGPLFFTSKSAMAPASYTVSTGLDILSISPRDSRWPIQRLRVFQATSLRVGLYL